MKGLRGPPAPSHVHARHSVVVLVVAAVVIAASAAGQRGAPGEANAAPSPVLTLDDALPPVLEEGHRVSPHRHRHSPHRLILRVGKISMLYIKHKFAIFGLDYPTCPNSS